jgi:protein-L-isoaspartate(D-aspartate) O-methyltransferase
MSRRNIVSGRARGYKQNVYHPTALRRVNGVFLRMTEFAAARSNMVEGQIRPNKVTDPAIVAAFMAIPREQFVPKAARGIAYVDEDIPVGAGRFLIEPMVLARLIQEAHVAPGDAVLVVGAGSGYSSAVLSRVAGAVVGLESDPDLVRRASKALADLDVENAVVIEGPLTAGHPRQAPYDVILVDGGVSEVPQALIAQLGENGRLVAVVAPRGRFGQAVLFERRGGIVSQRILFDAGTPLLPGFEPVPGFQF